MSEIEGVHVLGKYRENHTRLICSKPKTKRKSSRQSEKKAHYLQKKPQGILFPGALPSRKSCWRISELIGKPQWQDQD